MSVNASNTASRRRLMAGVVSVATFMLLCAVALPGMETSLEFVSILVLSVSAGVVSWAVMRYVTRKAERTS